VYAEYSPLKPKPFAAQVASWVLVLMVIWLAAYLLAILAAYQGGIDVSAAEGRGYAEPGIDHRPAMCRGGRFWRRDLTAPGNQRPFPSADVSGVSGIIPLPQKVCVAMGAR
jgi:hypothetical protein